MSDPVRGIAMSVFKRKGRDNFECQWRDPITGKLCTRSTGTNIKRDADRFAGKLMKDIESGSYRGRMRITWKEFADRYSTEYVSQFSECQQGHVAKMFRSVNKHVGPKLLAAVDESLISQYQHRLFVSGVSPATVRSYFTHLKAALRWAHRIGILAKVPQITMPKNSSVARGRPITTEEYERILVQTKRRGPAAASWKYLITGLWWSGLRIGEAMRLHWTDESGITVDLTGRRPMFKISAELNKSKRAEVFPMAPEFYEFLMQTPQEARSGFVFNPGYRYDVWAERCVRMPNTEVSTHVMKMAKAATVKTGEKRGKAIYATPHDFRRSFGFRWSKRVMPAVLQRLMRHGDIKTTMQFYVVGGAEDMADAAWAAVTNTSTNTHPPEAKKAHKNRPK